MKKDEKKHMEKETASGRMNPWIIVSAALGIAFLVVLALFLQSGGSATPSAMVSAETCGAQMIAYINENYVESGAEATFEKAVETNGVYQINTTYQGNSISVYATRDCHLLFLSYPVDVTETKSVPTTTITTPIPTPIKSAVPTVDLYVMSFCPYGVQAENSLKPVVDLLGDKADITVRYIVSVNGDTINNVSSLHGLNEAKEDARQLCIMQEYPDLYWSYLMQINAQCYPKSSNSTALDECWKATATGLGIDVSQVESCAYGSEGIALLKADETKADQNRVTGSPTLFINGQKYTGSRSSEAFKTAICNAFQTLPSECSMNLTSDVTPATGSC
jgi:glutaredoxin